MYFTVKKPLRIGKKYYRPCICYELTENLNDTVLDLANEGKTEVFEKPVFFQNGKKLEKSVVEVQEKAVYKRKDKKAKVAETTFVSDPEDDAVEGF